jgi:hypothetical protein
MCFVERCHRSMLPRRATPWCSPYLGVGPPKDLGRISHGMGLPSLVVVDHIFDLQWTRWWRSSKSGAARSCVVVVAPKFGQAGLAWRSTISISTCYTGDLVGARPLWILGWKFTVDVLLCPRGGGRILDLVRCRKKDMNGNGPFYWRRHIRMSFRCWRSHQLTMKFVMAQGSTPISFLLVFFFYASS